MTANKCGAQQACFHVDLCASIIAQLMRKVDKINGFLKLALCIISNEYIGYAVVELDNASSKRRGDAIRFNNVHILLFQIHNGSPNEFLKSKYN